ncbi:MAG: flavin reductase family protein [Pseudomonadota bacterium]
MFYEPKNGHNLPHNPFNAIVTPRPIAWVSTRSTEGADNLAPYSFFNAVAYHPPQVMIASTTTKADREKGKDTASNILESGVFCINIVEYAKRQQMNTTSGPYARDIDEFNQADIDRRECETIACSRVDGAPASLECRLIQSVDLPGEANVVLFGEVTGVHLRDDCMVNGRFDITTYQPLTRLGYQDYARITETFSLRRPGEN